MMDRVCVAEPRHIAISQHSQTQVALLAHVKEMFAKAADL